MPDLNLPKVGNVVKSPENIYWVVSKISSTTTTLVSVSEQDCTAVIRNKTLLKVGCECHEGFEFGGSNDPDCPRCKGDGQEIISIGIDRYEVIAETVDDYYTK